MNIEKLREAIIYTARRAVYPPADKDLELAMLRDAIEPGKSADLTELEATKNILRDLVRLIDNIRWRPDEGKVEQTEEIYKRYFPNGIFKYQNLL